MEGLIIFSPWAVIRLDEEKVTASMGKSTGLISLLTLEIQMETMLPLFHWPN